MCRSLAAAAAASSSAERPKYEEGRGGETPAGGFPLTGFLRVELVALPGAEVTFARGRPGAVLEKRPAELAAAEKKVRTDWTDDKLM